MSAGNPWAAYTSNTSWIQAKFLSAFFDPEEACTSLRSNTGRHSSGLSEFLHRTHQPASHFLWAWLQMSFKTESWTHVYIDGSAENAVWNGGAWVYIQYPGGREDKTSLTTDHYSTNYKAEAEALKTAAPHIEDSTHASHNVVLLTNTLSILQALQANRDTDHNNCRPSSQTGTLTTTTYLCSCILLQNPCSHPTVDSLPLQHVWQWGCRLWQRRAKQKSKWTDLSATLRWRPSSSPSNTANGGSSTHGTTRPPPTT